MTTEAFEGVKSEFYSVIYEIQNGTEKPEEKPNKLLDFVTKLLKWYSELLLRLFGSKGWSDIIFPKFNCGG